MSRRLPAVLAALFLIPSFAFGGDTAASPNGVANSEGKSEMLSISKAELRKFISEAVADCLEEKTLEFSVAAKSSKPSPGEGDSFLSRDGKKCEPERGDDSDDVPSENQEAGDCAGPDCQVAVIPTKRIYTTWVQSHKRVTITKPTPYISKERVWDEKECCWKLKYVTKYKNEKHEIIVPYMKEVLQEEIGHMEIEVCLDDIR